MRGLNIFLLTAILAGFTAKRDLGVHQQKLAEDPTTKKVSSNQEELSKDHNVPDSLLTTVNKEKLHLRTKRSILPVVSILFQEQESSNDPRTKNLLTTQEEQKKADILPENLLTMGNEKKKIVKKRKSIISTSLPLLSLYNRVFQGLFYQEEQSLMENDIEEKKQDLRKPQSILSLVNQFVEASVQKKKRQNDIDPAK